MNILTPAALEAAAEALYESRMALIVTQGRWASVPPIIQDEWKRDAAAAFNAAIARLIEEGRAKKGRFLNEATEPTIWDNGIFIKGEP